MREGIFYHEGTDTIYVEADLVMNPLIPLIDGLPVTLFGTGKRAQVCLTLDAAVAWCEREYAANPGWRQRSCVGLPGEELLVILRDYRRRWEAGEIEVVDP
jgi:hypothetical protein